MTKGTFWLERNAGGGVSIGIEDYGVEAFGGADYEWIYTFDGANTEKLIATLSKAQGINGFKRFLAPDKGTLESMIEEEFGIHLDKKSMKLWLDSNGIAYDFNSWVHSN